MFECRVDIGVRRTPIATAARWVRWRYRTLYSDQAEIAWWSHVSDQAETSDSFADSWGKRFKNIDSMLVAALQAQIEHEEPQDVIRER